MQSCREYNVITANKNMTSSVETVSSADGIEVVRVRFGFENEAVPNKVCIEWEEDMVNRLTVWRGEMNADTAMRQGWCPSTNWSRFCFGAPLLATIGKDGMNAECVAVSDPETPITLRYFVDDFPQKYKVKYSVTFFDGMCNAMKDYEAYIRIDTREIPYYESIKSVYPWWCEFGYEIPPIPAAAEDALYSSWYNFHQMPNGDAILRDLEIASELGFKTVILDDGWQFEGRPSGGCYSKCGDWIVARDKFADFAEFTRGVHKLGMKLMVWFTVPFIGVNSVAFERFKGKYLYDEGGTQYIVDPRYPEVREYIKDTYKRFLREYDIDGFKLDFIDSFRPGDTTAEFNDEMDTVTIDAAVKKLLEEIVAELGEIKPDLLFEYRQNYIGPAINRFGNMLRVGDCAYDARVNRIEIAKLRLLGYPIAIHSDMLYWAKEESVELCAKQLLNILFAVPQISVILADSTDEQKALLKNYLSYWNENRDIILHGKFRPLHPELNYTEISAEGEDKIITVLYDDLPYTYCGKDADVFCGGEKGGLIVENPSDRMLNAEIYDCFGECTETVSIVAGNIVRLDVPKYGMLKLKTQ